MVFAPMPRKVPRFLAMSDSEPDRIPATPGGIFRKAFGDSKWHILGMTLGVSIAYVSLALLPWALGLMLDAAMTHGVSAELAQPVLVFLGLVLLTALIGFAEIVLVSIWMRAAWANGRRLIRVLFGRRTDVGRDIPSGDLVTSITEDGSRIGGLVSYLPDAIASLIAAAVAIAMMIRISLPLGLVVAIGMPIVMFLTSRIVAPMQKRIGVHREESGILTSLATDGVGGLRVLRGVGGEDLYNERYAAQSAKVRDAGMKIATSRALLSTVESAGPNLFIFVVIGGGMFLTFEGQMSAGQLVSFYGLAGYLSLPLQVLSTTLAFLARARVGAKKISRILAADYLVSDARVEDLPAPEWAEATLLDIESGVVITPGKLTALVAATQAEGASIAARLARTNDSEEVRIDDVDLRAYPLAEVRRAIVYSGAISELYSGTLRSNLLGPEAAEISARGVREQVADVLRPGGEIRSVLSEAPGDHVRDGDILAALEIADGHDVLSSTRGGLNGMVAERGRSMSGGQRQRAALARALATNAPIMVLVEPTSAVDSHTESRIAERLAAARAGRTTVVVTGSPLMLGVCDEVIFLEEGREAARGTHHELAANPAYRAVVHRGEEEDTSAHPGQRKIEEHNAEGGQA